jgi:hypothetical protein
MQFGISPGLSQSNPLTVAFNSFEIADPDGSAYQGVITNSGTISAVPIPGSILLLGSGLVGLIGIARRKRS